MDIVLSTMKSLYNSVINVPIPSSISYMWNFGSILGLSLIIQIVSGFFLSMHYKSSVGEAFASVVYICTDMNMGWLVRSIHANGASMFFLFLFLHVGRGLYYGSFNMVTWFVGVTILIMVMAISFIGYVLPWGQMSFWGATVITNLLSTIPYVGGSMVLWLWGGFSVGGPTLSRFFAIHFILPIVLVLVVMVHLALLHKSGSSNPLGISPNCLKVSFHPYFSYKDILGYMLTLVLFFLFVFSYHDLFMDPDNFMEANPLVTPVHIQPEWYFLFAYAILRSITSKLGGVVALVMSLAILYMLPLMSSGNNNKFNPLYKFVVMVQFANFMLLTWLGCMPIEYPYIIISRVVAFLYFLVMLVIGLM